MSSLVERIEHIIKEKGLTFKRVERDCGLGNGTIKRWSEQSPRLDRLEVVSEYLQVSLDYLVSGVTTSTSKSGLVCDGDPLSEVESDLVAMFRLLNDKDQENAFDFVTLLYEKMTGEKGSVYSTYTDTNEQQKSGLDGEQKARHETA